MLGNNGEMTWQGWFTKHELTELCEFPDVVREQSWNPTEADVGAAWELYTEMRTRISTQPLPYRSGNELTALESICQLFGISRALLREHGPDCHHFATVAVEVLNRKIRPFTARWHKWKEAGLLEAEDGRHRFRGELQILQGTLRQFLRFLALMAEGEDSYHGRHSGSHIGSEASEVLGAPIPFDRLLGVPTAAAPNFNPQLMLKAEREDVAARRRHNRQGKGADDLVGLAISGGGIRSATFALGVLQGLAAKGVLKEVDLLSTVSGGGYLGGFLSSYLNDAETPKKSRADVGLAPGQLPFRRTDQCESRPLRFLRNHSKYLLPRGFLNRLTMVGQGLYGVLMNLVILWPLLLGAVLVTLLAYRPGMRNIQEAFQGRGPFPLNWQHFEWTLYVAVVWGVFVFVLPLVQKLARFSNEFVTWRHGYERLCIVLFAITLAVGIVQAIPVGYYAFLELNLALGLIPSRAQLNFELATIGVILGNVATFLSARGILWRAKQTDASKKQRVSIVRKLAFHLLWLTGPLLLVMMYYFLCHQFLVNQYLGDAEFAFLSVSIPPAVIIALVLPLIYSFGLLNVNVISPHRYYRNRLAETYLLRPQGTEGESVEVVDPQLLSEMGRTGKAPYHLINAAVNLPASGVPDLRGRDSDFFLFSKHFCGSPIVGYSPTKEWEACDGHLNLGTAVAISGAAASPHMGASTPRGASFFLTLLNVRLGYWLRRPNVGLLPNRLAGLLGGPGPLYLFREMFGWVDERSWYLNVSDGGHIENLAVYELLRRRCKFIIAIDGECDPDHEFPSLMKLQQFAWIDFGTQIDLDVDLLRLTSRQFSEVHFSMGRILYPEGAVGFLLYVKLSVSGNEADYVLDYHSRNPLFPHQPTTDQLFDESQFEAYRALGEHVTEDLFRPPLVPSDAKTPESVRTWFQSLATHLLHE